MSRRASTLKTTSYFTDNAGDLVLCRSGDLWTIGDAYGKDDIVALEFTTDVVKTIVEYLAESLPGPPGELRDQA